MDGPQPRRLRPGPERRGAPGAYGTLPDGRVKTLKVLDQASALVEFTGREPDGDQFRRVRRFVILSGIDTATLAENLVSPFPGVVVVIGSEELRGQTYPVAVPFSSK